MKKKILFFITTLNGGGAERLLVDLVNHMDAEKFDITVQTFYDVGIYRNQLNQDIRYKTIVSLENNILRRLQGRFFWEFVSPKYIYKKYIEDSYDYVVAFLEGIATKLISPAGRDFHSIAWVHSGLFHNFWTKHMYRSLKEQKKAYQSYEKIICVSNSTKKEFIQRFGNYAALDIKYNFVDKTAVQAKAEKNVEGVLYKKSFRMITLGRLTYQKGYDRLLSVIRDLIHEGLECELWIFGKGECQKKYERYILQNGLSSYVKLWGFQKNPYKYMKYCDLFVCSSRCEGYNLAIAEAMALGMPILSTYCTGPDELLDYGRYGMLVENNEKGLYSGIKAFYNSTKLLHRYSHRSKERMEFFDMHYRIKEIEKLFE